MPESKARKIAFLYFSRTPCLGTCPVYSVHVDRDGNVTWNGEHFVAVKGRATWSIGVQGVAKLEQLLSSSGLLSAYSHAQEDMTDQPGVNMFVLYDDGTGDFFCHYHGDMGAPESLVDLEDQIDVILGTPKYIGANPR